MRSVAIRSASIHSTSGRYCDGTVCQNTVVSSLVYALLCPPTLAMHRRVLFRLDVLRALEHHVLEEVRESGPSRLLVLRADVIPELDVHDRGRMIFRQHDVMPVGQRRDLDTAAAADERPHRGAPASARRRTRRRRRTFSMRSASYFDLSLLSSSMASSSRIALLEIRQPSFRNSGSLRKITEDFSHSLVVDGRISRDERAVGNRVGDAALADGRGIPCRSRHDPRRRPARRASRRRRWWCCPRCPPGRRAARSGRR